MAAAAAVAAAAAAVNVTTDKLEEGGEREKEMRMYFWG